MCATEGKDGAAHTMTRCMYVLFACIHCDSHLCLSLLVFLDNKGQHVKSGMEYLYSRAVHRLHEVGVHCTITVICRGMITVFIFFT